MTTYQRNKNSVASKLHDEIIMIDVTLGKYFAMNPIASDIWELIESPKSIEQITSVLMEKYEVDQQTCEQDVIQFIEELRTLNLITSNQ